MKISQWILATLVASSTLLPLSAAALTESFDAKTQEASKVLLARVNDQPIYQYQLEPQVQKELAKYQRVNPSMQNLTQLKKGIQKKLLQNYINAELIHQSSKKHPVNNLEEKISLFIKTAKEQGLPAPKKVNAKRQILINEYLEAHDLISPQPSEEEVKAFYEKGKHNFKTTQDKVHVLHIFITQENQEKMDKAVDLLKKGVPFEQVAKEYSEDENTKNNGGDLGFITHGYMPKEFEEVAFNIPTGKLSDIIKTEEGFHILKVLKITPKNTTVPYEKMKKFLAKGIAPEIKKKKIAAHLEKLKKEAHIDIFYPLDKKTND